MRAVGKITCALGMASVRRGLRAVYGAGRCVQSAHGGSDGHNPCCCEIGSYFLGRLIPHFGHNVVTVWPRWVYE